MMRSEDVRDVKKRVRLAAIITIQTGTLVFSRNYKRRKISESANSGQHEDIIGIVDRRRTSRPTESFINEKTDFRT
ncbi:hypothetical protein TcasGA2_TC011766 [Tribolium castaneum]|uniref:Uncharacterized protein n=1 Tax=Tribolium castaneum TaxID=7070 RepID=D6WZV0_TRICA|nr:hypothetical protein TcasGA2_TC011766 [Tribolium castaneum]